MSRTLQFFFDLLSPYAYLAHARLPALAERHGLTLDYQPVDLARLKVLAGNTGPGNRDIAIKHRYLRQDLRRWAEFYGVPFCPPAGYGSARINAGALYARDRDMCRPYVEWAWGGIWGEGRAMDDNALLREAAARFGWPEREFTGFVASPEAAQRLAAGTRAAHDAGAFGVPTMRLDNELWWGNDRLEFLERHLEVRAPTGKAPPAAPAGT